MTDGNPTSRIVKPGLDENPATSGEIFTDTAPYIKGTTGKARSIVEDFFRPIAELRREFLTYRDNPDYSDVQFSWDNGGLKATHTEHNFTGVGGEYEKKVQNVGYEKGHSEILEKEVHSIYKKKNNEGYWDGASFEIAGKKPHYQVISERDLSTALRSQTAKSRSYSFPRTTLIQRNSILD